MSDKASEPQDVQSEMRKDVIAELKETKSLAASFALDDLKSGEWFPLLLQKVVAAYDRNARAEYFQKKYPGLPKEEIADNLSSVTVRYAAIAGGVTGVAASASIVGTVAGGLTAPLLVGTIGTEMLYLARIQMRLVLDLANLYEATIDPNDPEDVIVVFTYALGASQAGLGGRLATHAAGHGTKTIVKRTLTGASLKAVQSAGRSIGFKILQRSVIKFAVPGASAAIGSGYNYVTTTAVSRIAREHFASRGKVTEEIRKIILRAHAYDVALPAALRYMAEIDGSMTHEERTLLRGMVTRMNVDDHTPDEVESLLQSEAALLEGLVRIDDETLRRSTLDALVLMAACDGQLHDGERDFLTKVAETLGLSLDLEDVDRRSAGFATATEGGRVTRAVDAGKSIGRQSAKTAGNIGRTAASTAGSASGLMRKVAGGVRSAASRDKTSLQCTNCSAEISADHRFCPGCGAAVRSSVTCTGCGSEVELQHQFCPNCGTARGTS